MTLIQEQLAKVGVGVKPFPGDQVAQDEAQRSLDTIQVYHSMVGRADFDVIKSQFYSANRNAFVNLDPATGKIFDPKLDRLLAKVASVPTVEARQAASAAVQQRLAEQAYVLPLFEEPQVYGLRDTVQGFETESVGRPSFYDVTLRK